MQPNLSTYIDGLRKEQKSALKTYIRLVNSHFKEGVWMIKYTIPTCVYNGKNIIHLGANQKHLGVYPGPKGIDFLKTLDSNILFSKGTWKIPYHQIQDYQMLFTQLLTWIDSDAKA